MTTAAHDIATKCAGARDADYLSTLPDPGEVPVLDWLSVDLLDVEDRYQRPEDEKRVTAILEAFAWDKFGSLVVTPKPDGRFNIIDGQHRAQAAKLHPKVQNVPAVVIVTAGIAAEASTFIGVNGDRKNVNALDLFFAKLAADDEDALTVSQVCGRAGVEIAKFPKSNFRAKQTVAVAALSSLIGKRGAMRAREILEVTAAGEFAPITANQIKAVEALITDPEFSTVAVDDLKALLAVTGTGLDAEAKRFAATHGCAFWRALASVWFQKCRKRRAPATPAARPADPIREAVRPAPQYRSLTGSLMGDPPLGRSALDLKETAQ